MTDFYANRREPLLDQEPCEAQRKRLLDNISFTEGLFTSHLKAEGTRKDAWAAWNGMIAYDKWCLMALDYSQGQDIQSLTAILPQVVEGEEKTHLPHPAHLTYTRHLAERDTFPYILSLLTFAKLLHLDHLIPRICAQIDVDRQHNRGQDKLYETIMQKLGLPRVPADASFKHFKAYPILLEAIEASAENRPKLMKAFLKKWYPSMKGVIWHDKHHKNPLSFIGYWCWEAALVTYLWDIDDASYRDMPYYPKDLVDWARQNSAPHNTSACLT